MNPKEVTVAIKNDVVSIDFIKPIRGSSDTYKIVVANAAGEGAKDLSVNILDVPSPPEGPLNVTDVFKDRCKLDWKPPKDTGGMPLLHYVIEKQEAGVRGWQEVGTTEGTNFDVTDLVNKKEYKFRIRAVNKKGTSEPLESPKGIVAKDPYDEPGKPTNVEATDWDKDHVDLKWNAPESDGGAPITGYIIEKRMKGTTKWEKGAEVGGEATNGTVPNLEAGKEYEFRVKAVNKKGESDASDASKFVLCKPRRLAPKIDRSNLNPITVRSGKPVKLEVDCIGEPPPTLTWSFRKQEVNSGGDVTIKNEPYHTMMMLAKTKRAQSGIWTLTAKNEHGVDEATVEITILSKPSKPGGPLNVTDVFADSCKVKWHKPDDDGGCPIEEYVIEKMDVDTGRWVKCGAVGPNDTEAKIDGLHKGKKYKFRVKAINKEGESDPLENEKEIEAKNPYDEPGEPGKPDIVDYDNERVDLKWKAPESDGGRPITSYIIEAKEKNTEWTPIFTTPDGKCEATVKGLTEGKVMEFRVKAVNLAGPGAPSASTGSHTVKHRNLKPYIDRTNLKPIVIKVGKSVTLDVDIRGEPPPKVVWTLKELKVTNDDHNQIDDVDYHTCFKLTKAQRKHSGKYVITATNASGKDEAAVEITVLGKPSEPKGPLVVDNVFAEGCELSWKKPADDGGTPIEEYLIEKMDVETGRWVKCKHVGPGETSAKIDGLIEGKRYKFRVKAINKEGESDPLENDTAILAKNPFEAASSPGKPDIVDYDNERVDLKWKAPESDGGRPITAYIIEAREKGTDWVTVLTTPDGKPEATVKGLIEGKVMEFRVRAVNLAGPSDPSESTGPHTVKHRNLKPHIDRTNLKSITIKVGRNLDLDVDVKGEPPPEITWFLVDDPVTNDENRLVKNTDYHTNFKNDKCT